MLTRAGVEDRIMQLSDELDTVTHEYEKVAQRAAEAEADYRQAKARITLALIQSGEKRTVQDREARADLMVDEELRNHLIKKAQRDSHREALLSIRATLDALRTLSASVRAQT